MFNEKGQSLLEVITAAAVGTLVVAALTFTTIFSLRNANFAKTSAQATKLAQEGIEKIRTLRDRDSSVDYVRNDSTHTSKFSDLWPIFFSCPLNCYFYLNSSGTLIGGTNTSMETIQPGFTRQFMIEDTGIDQKKVTVLVKWVDAAGEHASNLTTILRKL